MESESGMELAVLQPPTISLIHVDDYNDENEQILNAGKLRTRAAHKRASLQGGTGNQQQRRPSKSNLKLKRAKHETDLDDDEADDGENAGVIINDLEGMQTS